MKIQTIAPIVVLEALLAGFEVELILNNGKLPVIYGLSENDEVIMKAMRDGKDIWLVTTLSLSEFIKLSNNIPDEEIRTLSRKLYCENRNGQDASCESI